jgi:peptidoglycan biosynthesis protein MviN/MurJ (putative lipid II flippase)
MVSGQALITSSLPVDQAFAARLGGGAVATLGYANRIVTLFSTLGTVVVGRALLPVLAGAAADGDFALGRRQVLQWSFMLGACAVAGSALVWFVAPQIVGLLFERGAFTAAASAEVARTVRWGLIQLPFYFVGIAIVQWYAATNRFRAFLVITAIALVFKVSLNWVLVPRFGVEGIMMSTAAMYMVTTFLFLLGLMNRLQNWTPAFLRAKSEEGVQ